MLNPVNSRKFSHTQKVCTWVLAAIYGFLSVFGMGLHVLVPEHHGPCECHAEFWGHDSHDSQVSETELLALESEFHVDFSHSTDCCPICQFFLTHTQLSSKAISLQLYKTATRFVSFFYRIHISEVLSSFSVRAPPVPCDSLLRFE